MNKWNVLYVPMTGVNHQKMNQPCEDIISGVVTDHFACIVCADGAGTAKYAKEGAEVVVNTAKEWLTDYGETLFFENAQTVKEKILEEVQWNLQLKAQEKECDTDELAATFMFIASDGNHLMVANIGDGIIGMIDNDNKARVIMNAEKGRFVNETFFVTNNDAIDHFRVQCLNFNPNASYFLLTDGTTDCLYDKRNNSFAKMLFVFNDWLKRFDRRFVFDYIRKAMYSFFPYNTTDDCAIGFLLKKGGINDSPDPE